ncbi:Mov34/MPN/PAD-1 family protein [Phenylobacterium sp.]|uniref:Mov34/MPN/PAD-1 family protein n=1 Tax=Phenylobacterium sp. TaxID=1871053 RepID=UPI00345B5F0C
MCDARDGLYSDAEGRFQVLLERSAVERALTASRAAGRKETGGVLIGQYEDDGAVAIVAEATASPRGSFFGAFTFRRAPAGLRSLLAERWSNGQHYLGEWHSHPGELPEPSGRDRETMVKIAADHRYACREPLLLILGESPGGERLLTLHVFPRGQRALRLQASSTSRT